MPDAPLTFTMRIIGTKFAVTKFVRSTRYNFWTGKIFCKEKTFTAGSDKTTFMMPLMSGTMFRKRDLADDGCFQTQNLRSWGKKFGDMSDSLHEYEG